MDGGRWTFLMGGWGRWRYMLDWWGRVDIFYG